MTVAQQPAVCTPVAAKAPPAFSELRACPRRRLPGGTPPVIVELLDEHGASLDEDDEVRPHALPLRARGRQRAATRDVWRATAPRAASMTPAPAWFGTQVQDVADDGAHLVAKLEGAPAAQVTLPGSP